MTLRVLDLQPEVMKVLGQLACHNAHPDPAHTCWQRHNGAKKEVACKGLSLCPDLFSRAVLQNPSYASQTIKDCLNGCLPRQDLCALRFGGPHCR